MTIYILYSADYELFLGGNYIDEKEVLIEPTDRLLDFSDTLGIPITFFADVFSILRYREAGISPFPDDAENQLKDAIRRGHDVQSHVHPHWSTTRITGKTYEVNLQYFLLGSLDTDKGVLYKKVYDYLSTSKRYLDELLKREHAGYHCIAFRAGGYGLQPNSDVIFKALIDAGFLID